MFLLDGSLHYFRIGEVATCSVHISNDPTVTTNPRGHPPLSPPTHRTAALDSPHPKQLPTQSPLGQLELPPPLDSPRATLYSQGTSGMKQWVRICCGHRGVTPNISSLCRVRCVAVLGGHRQDLSGVGGPRRAVVAAVTGGTSVACRGGPVEWSGQVWQPGRKCDAGLSSAC
jgi:hypothetical protein